MRPTIWYRGLIWYVVVMSMRMIGPAGGACAATLGHIAYTELDSARVIHYATFQSHNQKVVAHEQHVYTTHLRTRNDEYTAQEWQLSHSSDGGRHFASVWRETGPTNPPALEIDSAGNLYLFRVDFVTNDAYLDRWPAGHGGDAAYRQTTRIPGGAAGKYAAQLDEPRQQLYFFSHNNTFHRLRMDGSLRDSRPLLREGPNAALQYPLLTLDESGWLHLAWTTQKHGVYLYWDIHQLLSRDGGDTFTTGDTTPLSLPIVADETGPAPRVTLDDEFTSHTWLSNLAVTSDHWHGLYLAQTTPPRQHYVRYSRDHLVKQIDRQPQLRGEQIELQGLDGFFTTDASRKRLYVVGSDQGRVACLYSDDEGETWHDGARTDEVFSLYAIGGYRHVMQDGTIIGTFTNQRPAANVSDANSTVVFFKITPP